MRRQAYLLLVARPTTMGLSSVLLAAEWASTIAGARGANSIAAAGTLDLALPQATQAMTLDPRQLVTERHAIILARLSGHLLRPPPHLAFRQGVVLVGAVV
jgi:hypothetical protein